MERKCEKCGEVIYKAVVLDKKGNVAFDVDGPQAKITTESGMRYCICPKCGYKNEIFLVPPRS